ncbi:D-alanyl-D-alanine carboxypeptidase [Halobacillus dabanensis]|uniref:D-alanyl-D-alanine carboxypeptidase n=1 Tax=Halobacillus dabanensis TaxID=240302 RepID=A0A1I3TD96_HALDA|nr:D-alanyl-D-alanine carboxypeptidase family protein [Halobacillus dabanensis]SFJ67701.1 D-alanyl-D-alanine carboxypeptidase [Halobacillus dabanensis]
MKKMILWMTIISTLLLIYPTFVLGATKPETPTIASDAAIVLEANTGKVLYEKNATTQLYPASLTKIATAIYAIEHSDLDQTVTVSEKAWNTGGSSLYLEEGEEAKMRDLVAGLLLNSGNDAGVAIAEHMSGSVEQFSEDMNDYLENEIGVQQTHFENPHGLFDPEHRTTAKDLALITKHAMENKTFNEMYGAKVMEWDGEKWDATLYTHHKLMREDPYEGVTGGKTGFVPQSGFTLATSATRENTNLIVITMKSALKDQSYEDTEKLLDYGFEHYETTNIEPAKEFQEAKDDFIFPQEVPFTHLKESAVEMKLEENGQMVIYEDGEERISKQLEKVQKEREPQIKEEVEEPKWKEYLPYFIFPKDYLITEVLY